MDRFLPEGVEIMSDVGRLSHFARVSPQLPLSWYFDPTILEIEKEVLFARGPGFVGHALQIPESGDYYTLPWEDGARALVRHDAEPRLLSNICRHRQAIMLEGRGNTGGHIVCPLHRWTYDTGGQLMGAPHFNERPCLHLPVTPLQSFQGLLFEGQRPVQEDLGAVEAWKDLDFSGYLYHSTRIEHHAFNWKTFIEVYLEDYHVVPFHPGLGGFVDCDDLRWEFGEWHSVQTVGVHRGLQHPGSETYRRWHDEVLNRSGGARPKHGAIWAVYYPNIMVEWYPNVLVVSSVWPRGPENCINVIDFYYPEDIALFEPDFVAAEQAAYLETALEDDEICARMHRGRRALYQRGIEEHGPYQSPMEDGLQHYQAFLRAQIEPVLNERG
jgi:phenylpropionate dioxygenase-like ring-hydroxylating dioxygenase large terminal subunit